MQLFKLIQKKDFIDKAFVSSVLFASLFPSLEAIDNVSIRWFIISVLSLVYFLINKKATNNNLVTFLILFLLPIFFTKINYEHYLTSYLKLILIIIVLNFLVNSLKGIKTPISFISKLFIFSLIIENLYLFIDYSLNPETFTGISMNRNISSFSILLKLPLILYQIFNLELSKSKKWILNIVHLTSIICIITLQSRLAIMLLLLIYLYTFFRPSINKKKFIVPILVIASTLLLILNSSNSILNSKKFLPINFISDTSLSQRLEYLSNALILIKEKPLLGHGLGSWKIESLRFANYGSDNTIIPYYVHNDLVQFSVELGILGLTSFIIFFIFLLKQTVNSNYKSQFKYFLLLGILIFLIDSSFNFPFHRPQELITFLILTAIAIKDSNINFIKYRLKKLTNFSLFLLLLISVFLSFREHKSLVDQRKLLNDYYGQKFSNNTSDLKNVNYTFPSLASNTIPISSLLARYYMEENKLQEARTLLNFSNKVNSYDVLTKQLRLTLELQTNNFIDAFNISKELYDLNQQNIEYAEIYFSIASSLNLNQFFELSDIIYRIKSPEIHKSFYKNYLSIENYNIKLLEALLEISINDFPSDIYFKKLKTQLNKN